MDISERKRGDLQRLARIIARESNAMQRDRLRSVLLVLQGRQTLEVTAAVGRSRAFVQRWADAYRDGGLGDQGIAADRRPPERLQVDLGLRCGRAMSRPRGTLPPATPSSGPLT